MSGTVYILGAGPWQSWLIRAARRLGLRTVVADRDANAPGMALADDPRAIDIADHAALAEDARRLAPDAVVSSASDVGVLAAEEVRRRLGMPDPFGNVGRLMDKEHVHGVAAEAGLAMPRFAVLRAMEQAGSAAEGVGFPAVVKPVDNAGGRGVTLVDDTAGIDHAVRRALATSRSGRALVEEFVAGTALSGELFMRNGEMRFFECTNTSFVRRYVSPCGHSLPSRLDASLRRDVEAFAARAAKALGVTDGPLNLDLRITEDGPVLIEVNPRSGGSNIGELVYHSTGVDLAAELLRLSLGEPCDLRVTMRRPAATRLLVSTHEGVVSRVMAPPDHPSLVERSVLIRPGDWLPVPAQNVHLLGWVLAVDTTLDLAESTVRSLADAFHVA